MCFLLKSGFLSFTLAHFNAKLFFCHLTAVLIRYPNHVGFVLSIYFNIQRSFFISSYCIRLVWTISFNRSCSPSAPFVSGSNGSFKGTALRTRWPWYLWLWSSKYFAPVCCRCPCQTEMLHGRNSMAFIFRVSAFLQFFITCVEQEVAEAFEYVQLPFLRSIHIEELAWWGGFIERHAVVSHLWLAFDTS